MLKSIILALAVIAPLAAHAGGPSPGLLMAPVRTQIKQDAQKAKMLSKGERLTISKIKGQPGFVEATIWSKGFGWGGPTKGKMEIAATAKFKITQAVEGQFATPVKSGGQVWAQRFYGVGPVIAPAAKALAE